MSSPTERRGWAVPGATVVVGSREHHGWEEAEYDVVGLHPGTLVDAEFLQVRRPRSEGPSLFLRRRFGSADWSTAETGDIPVAAWYGEPIPNGVAFAPVTANPDAWPYVIPHRPTGEPGSTDGGTLERLPQGARMNEPDSIDAVRADLAAAGRDPNQLQWAEAVTSWDEGKIVCYRDGKAVVVKHVGRDESSDLAERYDSEAAAAQYLRRALVDREVRVLDEAERNEIAIRTRRHAEETKARLRAEQESP